MTDTKDKRLRKSCDADAAPGAADALPAGEKRLRWALGAIPALWVLLIPVMMVVYPGVAWHHCLWTALLLANMAVWPIVLIVGAAAQVRRGVLETRREIARRKAERDAAPEAPADPRLSLQ